MMHRFLAAALGAAALLATGPTALAQDDGDNGPAGPAETYRYLDMFGQVFERVRRDYVEEISDEELIEYAINGMLTSLDPHSGYLTPRNFQDMRVQTRGEFGGLGIEVTMENGWVKVVSPIDDTPAARAGLQPGDFITHLDGEEVLGLTLSEAVERMRGPVDTDLTVTVRRNAEEQFDVTITRAVIRIESVRWRREGDVMYLRVTSFTEQTEDGVRDAFREAREEIGAAMKGVVLDLRNNPGGLLDQAVAVADAFLERGEVVSTRARHAADTQRFNAESGDLAQGLPIVVLINGGSASASEIVAGALQDHRRAIVLGTKSFGKGSVQTIIPVGGSGAAMRLTTARYYTPSGRSIQAVGIEPDILVEPARIEVLEGSAQARTEADLRGALQNENGDTAEPGSGGAAGSSDTEAARSDYQLTRALDLIRGLSLYDPAARGTEGSNAEQ